MTTTESNCKGLVEKMKTCGSTRIEKEKKLQKDSRKPAVSVPFVSTAELMKKFHSGTRDFSLPNTSSCVSQSKALTLTKPKEPALETSRRVRLAKQKNTEQEKKIPKFKARPLNKKVLEAPAPSAESRSKPQPPQFQELHLKTTARALQKTKTASEISVDVSRKKTAHHLTKPKSPHLHTTMRARQLTVKDSCKLEKEELEMIPKFKARPVNKQMFELKGEMGPLCHKKNVVTVPLEYERIPPLPVVTDLFDKKESEITTLTTATDESNLGLDETKVLEAPAPSAVSRGKPQPPQFQEFHLKTAARALQKTKTASEISVDVSRKKTTHHLTKPKSPHLHTTMRARQLMVKNSCKLEKEELEMIPKFKVRPVNKKMFESKGEMGPLCHKKNVVTVPLEYERIPPPPVVTDLFDKKESEITTLTTATDESNLGLDERKIFEAPTTSAVSRSIPQPPKLETQT